MMHKLSTLTVLIALSFTPVLATAAMAIQGDGTATMNCPQKDAYTAEINAVTKQLNDTKTKTTAEINALVAKQTAAMSNFSTAISNIKSATDTAFSMKLSAEIQKQWILAVQQCPKSTGSVLTSKSTLNTCAISKVMPAITNANAMLASAQAGVGSILQKIETDKARQLAEYTQLKTALTDKLTKAKKEVEQMAVTRVQIERDIANMATQAMFNSDYSTLMTQVKSGLNQPASIENNFDRVNSEMRLKAVDLENQLKTLEYKQQQELVTQEKLIAQYKKLLAQITVDKNKLGSLSPATLPIYANGSQSAIYDAQKAKILTGSATVKPLLPSVNAAYDTWKKLGYDIQSAQSNAAQATTYLLNQLTSLKAKQAAVLCPLAGGVPIMVTIK